MSALWHYPRGVLSRLVLTVALLLAAGRGFIRLRGASRVVVLRVMLRQVLFTGVEALPLISLLGASVGVLVILQSVARMPAVGQAEFMGKLLVLFILRELGPILVAFVVAARSGTAIAAELGLMSVRGEIDGLLGVGVDPLVYLVWPRVVAVAVAVASLTVVFNTVAFVAGFGFAAFSTPNVGFLSLFENLFRAMTLQDILLSVLKSGGMGVAIAGICAFRGLSVRDESTMVPVSTLRAVVAAFWACLFIEIALTVLFTDLGSLVT